MIQDCDNQTNSMASPSKSQQEEQPKSLVAQRKEIVGTINKLVLKYNDCNSQMAGISQQQESEVKDLLTEFKDIQQTVT